MKSCARKGCPNHVTSPKRRHCSAKCAVLDKTPRTPTDKAFCLLQMNFIRDLTFTEGCDRCMLNSEGDRTKCSYYRRTKPSQEEIQDHLDHIMQRGKYTKEAQVSETEQCVMCHEHDKVCDALYPYLSEDRTFPLCAICVRIWTYMRETTNPFPEKEKDWFDLLRAEYTRVKNEQIKAHSLESNFEVTSDLMERVYSLLLLHGNYAQQALDKVNHEGITDTLERAAKFYEYSKNNPYPHPSDLHLTVKITPGQYYQIIQALEKEGKVEGDLLTWYEDRWNIKKRQRVNVWGVWGIQDAKNRVLDRKLKLAFKRKRKRKRKRKQTQTQTRTGKGGRKYAGIKRST